MVCGMIVSLNESFKTSFTVKLTPSIVIEPFGITYFRYSFGIFIKKSVEFPLFFIELIVPIQSHALELYAPQTIPIIMQVPYVLYLCSFP